VGSIPASPTINFSPDEEPCTIGKASGRSRIIDSLTNGSYFMSEQDMAILIQALIHYFNPKPDLPTQAHIITTLRRLKSKDPGWKL
jgi:hypothetical protein